MLKQLFLQEIQASNLMMHSAGYDTLNHISKSIIDGTFKPEAVERLIVSSRGDVFNDDDSSPQNPFDAWADGSVAIIPLVGVMMKNGYWWGYGTDDVAAIIKLAYLSPKISAVILKADTPGGSVDSLFLLEEVLSDKTKPTYGFIDGMCASCGYLAFSYLDKIFAINKMARVGSIGVLARFYVPTDDNAYYKVIEVYPDESKDKNLPVREAIEGKPEKMKEELSKLAVYFQETVKANRKKISPEALTGATYYAYEAQELGMIDGICSLSEVVEKLNNIVSLRQNIIH